MKRLLSLLSVVVVAWGVFASQLPEGLSVYKLENGLTVYLWEDHDQPDVHGYTITRAGSIDEPETATGLAHYLEHMLFKGTETIGALDWEKEKPLYEQVLSLYEELSQTDDSKERDAIQLKINEASRAAAQYSATDEFSNLVQGIGGENLNAFTTYDFTAYFNTFPSYELERWLTLYTDRLINPVFRTFQAELENVFEEYNMYLDDNETHVRNFVSEKLYEGHPYARDVIGYPEDLKNPKLRQLIEFFNTWYVPNNMALVLVGDFSSEEARPLIEKTFGKLQPKPLPIREPYDNTSFDTNEHYKAALGYMPELIWGYKGVPVGHKDEQLLEFALSLLSNDMNIGLLDRLAVDSKVMVAQAALDSRRDAGRVMLITIPYMDPETGVYTSDKKTEELVFAEVEKLCKGDFSDRLLESVRENYRQNYERMLEYAEEKTSLLMQAFAYNQPVEKLLEEMEAVSTYSREDVKRVAELYLTAPSKFFSIAEGNPKKNKLPKPQIKPIDPPQGVSAYYEAFQNIPTGAVKPIFCNFDEVDRGLLYDNVRLFRTANTKNSIFTLRLKYGIGTEKSPLLDYAVQLMNLAGVQGNPGMSANEFREQLAELGGKCSYAVDDSWLYVDIEGNEDKMEDIIKLVNLQMLFPDFGGDDTQLNNVKGQAYMSRRMEKRNTDICASAFYQYVLYGDKSPFINRPSLTQIMELTPAKLSAEFHKALDYALDIHYVGTLSIDSVAVLLKDRLPMQEFAHATESPIERTRWQYPEAQVFFLPDKEMQQAKVYFFTEGEPYSIKEAVAYNAFNEYYGDGFSGIVMNEIREKRSLAYTAVGAFQKPQLQGRNTFFVGYVGTQSDKVNDVLDVYMNLIDSMPLLPENMERLRIHLRQMALADKPSFRRKSQVYADWMRLGYNYDPAIMQVREIQRLKFEQIEQFYQTRLQGKSMVIAIMGDPKQINLKAIPARCGKVKKVQKSRIFSAE